jgi:hypothetical protein
LNDEDDDDDDQGSGEDSNHATSYSKKKLPDTNKFQTSTTAPNKVFKSLDMITAKVELTDEEKQELLVSNTSS